MSEPIIVPTAAAIRRLPSAREARIRRIVSMILSCVTIAGSALMLAVFITDPGYPIYSSTTARLPLVDVLMSFMQCWIVPGIIALVLLSSLPRPCSRIERLPKIFGIVAVALSALCSLYVPAIWTLFVTSFFIDYGWLFS